MYNEKVSRQYELADAFSELQLVRILSDRPGTETVSRQYELVKVIERTFTTLGRNEPWRAMATKQKHCDQLFNDAFPLKI